VRAFLDENAEISRDAAARLLEVTPDQASRILVDSADEGA